MPVRRIVMPQSKKPVRPRSTNRFPKWGVAVHEGLRALAVEPRDVGGAFDVQRAEPAEHRRHLGAEALDRAPDVAATAGERLPRAFAQPRELAVEPRVLP